MTTETARNIETTILRALAEHGQRETAEGSGLTTTRLSRWKKDDGNGGGLHLPIVAAVLAELGLAVVDTNDNEMITVPREEYEALRTLARVAVTRPRGRRGE